MNILQIENNELGQYLIILNDDQIKQLIKTGTKNIQKRIIISPDSQKNNQNGFINNKTDWSKFFPNERNENIQKIFDNAEKWEKNLKLTISTITTLLSAGLAAHTPGGKTIVNKILGSFTNNENQNVTENIQNITKEIT